MFLRIQLNSSGQFLVLKKNGALTVELHTTFFNEQADFLGSFSYPFDFPLEPNRAALKNAQYIPTSSALRTVWVTAFLGAWPWKVCKMNFTVVDDNVQATLYLDSTLISSKLSSVQLNQLYGAFPGVPSLISNQINTADFGGVAAYMLLTTQAALGTMPMVFFPWKDDGAYKAPGNERVAFQGNYNAATNTPALHDNNGSGIRPVGLTEGCFYKCTESGMVDTGNGPFDIFEGDFVMLDGDGLWYVNPNPYGVRVDGYSGLVFPSNQIINRWEMDPTGAGSFLIDPIGGPYCQSQAPAYFVWFIIKRCFAWFGINTVVGSVLQEDWFLQLTIWSRITLDSTGIINDCTYYMPAMTIADFFKELRSEGIFINFDMTLGIGIVESIANLSSSDEVIDLRPFQVKGYRETSLTSTYYVVSQPVDPDDGAFPEGYEPLTMQIGEADPSIVETDITIEAVGTTMVTEQAPTNLLNSNLGYDEANGIGEPIVADWRIPYIKQAVYATVPFDTICTVAYGDRNNFKLRLLSWLGMTANSAGYMYPYGSADNRNVNNVAIGSFTLSFTPAATEFQPLQFYYNFILNSKPFEQSFLLTKEIMIKLAANKRYLVYDDKLRATISCLLDQAATDLTGNNDLAFAKLILYPVILLDNTVQPAPVIVVPPPVDNGVVYVRLSQINGNTVYETEPDVSTTDTYDLELSFFSDEAGTVPKSVTGLAVRVQTQQNLVGGAPITPSTITYTCTGESQVVYPGAPVSENITGGADAGASYTWVYTLLVSVGYNIIS